MAAPIANLSMLDSLLAATAAQGAGDLVAAGTDVLPGGSPVPAGAGAGAGAGPAATPGSARAAAKPRQRGGAASGRAVMMTGARLRWTAEEDEELKRAVTENRGAPTKKSVSGIRWAEIQRRAPSEYLLLMRHLTTPSSKCLSKRWCQFLSPDDQPNKARKWR